MIARDACPEDGRRGGHAGDHVPVAGGGAAGSGPAYAGKVVIVTGASSGIGRALCEALAPQGPRLVLAARDQPRLEAAAEACRARGAETLVVPTDVTRPEECARLVAASVSRFGGVDVLVNNAGAGMIARFDEVTDLSIFERLMSVNYLGQSPMQESRIMTAGRCAAMMVPAMEKRKRQLVMSLRGRVGRFVRLVAPGIIDGVARQAVARGR